MTERYDTTHIESDHEVPAQFNWPLVITLAALAGFWCLVGVLVHRAC